MPANVRLFAHFHGAHFKAILNFCSGKNGRRMKFGEKYELRESLTTGAVETFVANDKIRGQRVLVHILDCGPLNGRLVR
jgi:hypothetical protein